MPTIAKRRDQTAAATNVSRCMQNIVNRLVGISVLVGTAPTLALVALVLRLGSRGPIFHRYMRTDQSGRAFEAWAFRIYRVTSPSGATISPQLTAIGRFLWWTRLSDLPIVINLSGGSARVAVNWSSKSKGASRIDITVVATH